MQTIQFYSRNYTKHQHQSYKMSSTIYQSGVSLTTCWLTPPKPKRSSSVTTEMNLPRHNYQLTINGQQLEGVQQYKYLGTILTNKLSFSQNTTLMVEKARKRLYIMSKLSYLGAEESLRKTAYTSFIESVLTFHLAKTYKHLSASDLKRLKNVNKSASYLGRIDLRSLDEIYTQTFKKRVLLIYTDLEPIINFDRLPSGRFRSLKRRTNLRKNCFRSVAIDLLNKVFS